jgi:hypothetical protein
MNVAFAYALTTNSYHQASTRTKGHAAQIYRRIGCSGGLVREAEAAVSVALALAIFQIGGSRPHQSNCAPHTSEVAGAPDMLRLEWEYYRSEYTRIPRHLSKRSVGRPLGQRPVTNGQTAPAAQGWISYHK